MTVFENRTFKTVIKAIRVGANPIPRVSLLEEIWTHKETVGVPEHRGKAT